MAEARDSLPLSTFQSSLELAPRGRRNRNLYDIEVKPLRNKEKHFYAPSKEESKKPVDQPCQDPFPYLTGFWLLRAPSRHGLQAAMGTKALRERKRYRNEGATGMEAGMKRRATGTKAPRARSPQGQESRTGNQQQKIACLFPVSVQSCYHV